MKQVFLIRFVLLFVGLIGLTHCAVNSITPSGPGFELNIGVSEMPFRHGWAVVSNPSQIEDIKMDSASLKHGRKLFLQHCEKCHGADGKSVGPLAQTLGLRPADLTQAPKGRSGQSLVLQIQDGKGSMPKWKDILTETQVEDLVVYLRELAR